MQNLASWRTPPLPQRSALALVPTAPRASTGPLGDKHLAGVATSREGAETLRCQAISGAAALLERNADQSAGEIDGAHVA
jgi:hypothetical protein